ncbi:hypothetical protein SLEP1_g20506 [Rubroshorea leprosula]|uniref:Secreted protein n=1 Tax=Rubroshorea leprosula TaxID=152421 RepID=A0AAV5JDG8_9ROSI|nr:hypothetical protein SLEP1_g20506 [Rubroshorea leprosula]
MLSLCSSWLTLALVLELYSLCLSFVAHSQPLHFFVVELCSSCFSILNLGLLHFAARDSAIIISDFYSSQLVHEQDACSSCSSISQLVLKQDACSSSLPSLIGLLRKAKWCWTVLLLPSWCTALSFAAAELDCFVAAELDRLVAVELGCCAAAKLLGCCAAAKLNCFVAAAKLNCFVAAVLGRFAATELGCSAAAELEHCFELYGCRAGLLYCCRAELPHFCRAGALF